MTSAMTFSVLDTVVLERDLPKHGLKRGDVGAVVEVYEPDGVVIEFVAASGRTQAVVALKATDVRPVAEDDLLTVRRVARSA